MPSDLLEVEFLDAELKLARARAGGAKHATYLPELKAANEAWAALYRPRLQLRDEERRAARARAQAILSKIAADLSDSERSAIQPFTVLSL